MTEGELFDTETPGVFETPGVCEHKHPVLGAINIRCLGAIQVSLRTDNPGGLKFASLALCQGLKPSGDSPLN